jgi:hypothetical protein
VRSLNQCLRINAIASDRYELRGRCLPILMAKYS